MTSNDYKVTKSKYNDLKKNSKRSICNHKMFDDTAILDELIKTGSLKKLHDAILSTHNIDSTKYDAMCEQISRSINAILLNNNIKTEIFNNNRLIELIQHVTLHSKLPSLYEGKLNSTEKDRILNEITAYTQELLEIKNIGYQMCVILYDVYNHQQSTTNQHRIEIIRHFIQETIEYFDSNNYVVKNFAIFQNHFKDTLQVIARQLEFCVLPNYLHVAKTYTGIKIMSDINKTDMLYLKNVCNQFQEKTNKISTEKADIEKQIQTNAQNVADYKEKISTLLRDSNVPGINFDKSLMDLYKKENAYWVDHIKEAQIKLSKLRQNAVPRYEFEMPNELINNYRDKLVSCINDNKNVLVPVGLLDLTKSKQVHNIKSLINEKQHGTLALSYLLKLHANMIFINNEKKYIEYFEPHGINGVYNVHEVFNAVQAFHTALIPKLKEYTFVPYYQVCPIISGPQALDNSEYCYIHSGYYGLLRILYPNYSSQEIGTMLISKINKNFDEKAQPTNISLTEYLQQKYTPLSGLEIKRRMENFMKWHRYVAEFNHSPQKDIILHLLNIVNDITPKIEYD